MTYTSQIGQYANTIKSDALKESPSQQNSRHQLRVLENLNQHTQDIERARLNLKNMSAGVLISDYGKTDDGKELLTIESPDSNLLITTLQTNANNKSAALIKELLASKFGAERSAMFNPKLSMDEVRKQFKDEPKLLGFYHELEGLILLIKDYNAGEMTKEEFTSQFWSTFAHNGPQKGYSNIFVGTINEVREKKGLTLHLSTPFANAQGEFMYPDPDDEALLHTTYDRLDQAQDGIAKIAIEVSKFQDLKDVNSNLLGTNAPWTIEQLDALKVLADKAIQAKPELGFIGQVIDKAKSTIERFMKFVQTGLSWEENGDKQTLSFKHPDGTIEALHKHGKDDYEHTISVAKPSNREEFMAKNASQFLSRVVRNFKEEDRYIQAA